MSEPQRRVCAQVLCSVSDLTSGGERGGVEGRSHLETSETDCFSRHRLLDQLSLAVSSSPDLNQPVSRPTRSRRSFSSTRKEGPLTQKCHADAALSTKQMRTLSRDADFCLFDTKDRRMKLKLTCWSVNQCSVDGEKFNFKRCISLFLKYHQDGLGLRTPGR